MTIPLFQIDAFSRGPFTGNPAAVCLLEGPIEADLMQSIAEENNLSETAFVVPIPGSGGAFALRWFTPSTEVELCGHATLAAAEALRVAGTAASGETLMFSTMSGPLSARLGPNGAVTIDLPAAISKEPMSPERSRAVEIALHGDSVGGVRSVFEHRYAMAVLGSEAEVVAAAPSQRDLREIGIPLIITAPGDADGVDFVSRFFAPTLGVLEDPVTGSAHCQLVPYWAAQIGRPELVGRQLSKRGGELRCVLAGDRVHLTGSAHLYMKGGIEQG